MKLFHILNALALATSINGVAIPDGVLDISDPLITLPPEPHLEKRINADAIEKERQKLADAEAKFHGSGTSLSDYPSPWIRTIYGSVVERVVPTVVAGVTLSAKPPKETNGLEGWISLQKNGKPKTIRPQLKNGHTKNPSPTYGTWFATPTTRVYTKEELKAHNMADDEVHTEIEWIEDDDTYHSLNPIMRCTPDSYFKKGLNKNMLSEPFCFPKDNSNWKVGEEYFITWFSKFFDAERVRFHLSGVKPSLRDHGLKKRQEDSKEKRSAIMENGGTITAGSFWKSDWVSNDQGMYPMEILESFLKDESQMERKVLLSIQPDNVSDEDFDLLKNSLVLEIIRPGKVYKHHNEDLKLLEEKQKNPHLQVEIEDGINYEKYFAIMGIPTVVIFLAFCMYCFAMYNKVDLSDLKVRKAAGKNHNHRRIPFKKKNGYLPQHNSDIPLQTYKGD